MASETLYYYFSLISVLGAGLYLVNLLLLRTKGKTTYGLSYKPGTKEYGRVVKLASNRNLIIVAILVSALTANLIYDINRLIGLDNRQYAHTTLVSAPVVTVLFFILMTAIVRRQLSDHRPTKH